jgi:uncharacterized protein YgiM (DUF1202 family)
MQENSQTVRTSSSTYDKSLYIAALGGVAAGLTIAAMVWLAKSLLSTDEPKVFSPDSNAAVYMSEVRKTNDQLHQLNNRIELLTKSITRLTRIMEPNSSTGSVKMAQENSFLQETSDTASGKPKINASDIAPHSEKSEDAFVTTHTVKTRLNLRSSPSLHATTIAILDTGAEVEYIREDDGWYYVNTELHWKGWCASEYLSPLPASEQ